jgi:hypothetical protein
MTSSRAVRYLGFVCALEACLFIELVAQQNKPREHHFERTNVAVGVDPLVDNEIVNLKDRMSRLEEDQRSYAEKLLGITHNSLVTLELGLGIVIAIGGGGSFILRRDILAKMKDDAIALERNIWSREGEMRQLSQDYVKLKGDHVALQDQYDHLKNQMNETMKPYPEIETYARDLVMGLAECIAGIEIREKLETDVGTYKAKVAEHEGDMRIVVNAVRDLADTIAKCPWPDQLRIALREFVALHRHSPNGM